MSGMFEYMAAHDDTSRVAGRKALALARARATKRFAKFLGKDNDRQTRLALVAGDLTETVKQACADTDYHDWEGVLAAVTEHLGGVAVESARRPKMCPVHREITDISLQQQDPQAGFAAMAQHMFGEKSCRGSWEDGRCNFKPEMATQTYWDNKAEKAEQRRQERQQQVEQAAPLEGGDIIAPDEPVADATLDMEVSTPDSQEFDFDLAEVDFGGDSPVESPAMSTAARIAAVVPNPVIHGGSLAPLGLIAQKKPGLMVNGAPFEHFAAEAQQRMSTEGMPQYESIEISHPHPEWERIASSIAQEGHDGALREFMNARRQQRQQPAQAQQQFRERGERPRLPQPEPSNPNLERMGKTAEALETVDVTKGGETPLPKMDKRDWTPENVTFIDADSSDSPHPTHHQDITQPVDHTKEDFLDQTRAVTETQYVGDGEEELGWKGPNQWTVNNGTSPVTSAQDPDRNPIRDSVIAEFPAEEDVAAAIEAYQGR